MIEETIGNGNKYQNKIKTPNFSQSSFTLSLIMTLPLVATTTCRYHCY